MAIFFTSSKPVLPTIRSTIEDALRVNPQTLVSPEKEAADRTVELSKAVSPEFSSWRFLAALVIAVALLLGAIWTAQHGLADISKALMTSFTAYSGIVLGLLGGEAQKAPPA